MTSGYSSIIYTYDRIRLKETAVRLRDSKIKVPLSFFDPMLGYNNVLSNFKKIIGSDQSWPSQR